MIFLCYVVSVIDSGYDNNNKPNTQSRKAKRKEVIIMAKTYATCTRCGAVHPVSIMTATTSAKRGERSAYICQRCATQNMYYHATNDKVLGTDKVNAVFCGIEFECSYSDEYARNAMFEYGFIPTHDCSIRSDGLGRRYGSDGNSCEYVSGLMKGLNRASKFALTCDYLVSEGHLKVNDSCGTHFHVSIDSMKDAHGEKTYMGYISRFYHSLFIPLNEAMTSNPEAMHNLFGRGFGHYCESIDRYANPAHDRYLWINVTNSNNIEFRLNRFVSGKQYQNLMKMEVEMVKCIVTNFCEHFNDTDIDSRRYPDMKTYRKHKADVTAKKLVKIYQKYANC